MGDGPICRFAPSPTGFLHVGSAHSALVNWLFARQSGGTFRLRIEDTDTERDRPELVDNVLEMLAWLGIDHDGEPVRQSANLDHHRSQAEALVEEGAAYHCDCTTEAVRARNEVAGGPPGYDGHCRDRALGPGPGRVIRFRTPDVGATAWDDVVRDEVRFENRSLEDFVLVRSTGTPTFILANASDDAAMGITHVIRGEDHVNSTPKYLLLREALGLGRPAFAHLPLLVNEARKKLSKRRDDVSVADYKARGFLPEAMVNYLALLGWGPPDGVEVRARAEICELFRLEEVNPSPAFFDVTKLTHVNGEHIRALSPEDFRARAREFLPDEAGAVEALEALTAETQERVRTLAEVPELIDFLWREVEVDGAAWDKAVRKAGPEMLEAAIARLAEVGAWNAEAVQAAVDAAAADVGLVRDDGTPQRAKAQGPIRVAVTGRAVGPPLWESLAALGPERTLDRLRAVRGRLV